MTTFTKTKKLLAAAGIAAAAVAGLTATAVPANAAATAPCESRVGYVAPTGHHGRAAITATIPPTTAQDLSLDRIFQPGAVRLATNLINEPSVPASFLTYGNVVIGDALYDLSYSEDVTGHLEGPVNLKRIGGGWSTYVALEKSIYDEGPASNFFRSHAYGLRKDGVLTRWTTTNGTWSAPVSYAGLGTVKAMALISKTRTYDTFLVNRSTGELQTIRIPTTAPLKPVITTVRTRSWQGMEAFVAHKCGQYGTLLTAIDKDAKAAYVYAIGHANGTSTVIQTQGKAPGTFDAPVYHRWGVVSQLDPLNGD